MTRKKATDPEEALQTLMDGSIAELEAHLEVLAARRKELQPGSFDRDLAMAAAALARALTSAVAERRHQRKAAAGGKLTPMAVLEWVRELDDTDRVHFLHAAGETERASSGSVLE